MPRIASGVGKRDSRAPESGILRAKTATETGHEKDRCRNDDGDDCMTHDKDVTDGEGVAGVRKIGATPIRPGSGWADVLILGPGVHQVSRAQFGNPLTVFVVSFTAPATVIEDRVAAIFHGARVVPGLGAASSLPLLR